MAGSGTGRGRGWLNLNKSPNSSRPGGVPSTNYVNESLTQELNASTLNSQSQYPRLLAAIEQLDPNDDGILMNQKFKNILQLWVSECNSSAEVEESFKCIYAKCRRDASLATKVATMVSSYSFITKEIHSVKIRNLFIAHIQNDFEIGKQLQVANPTAFHNSFRMLGEFYSRARLADGRVIKFLAAPITHYLCMLLESAQPADLELFTIQLYLNGHLIKDERPQKLQEILIQVRLVLLSNANLTQISKTWLLLALDVAHNRYGLLSADVTKFYQEQLGEKAVANFQGTHCALSIQTAYSNKTLDGYQSTVSVLQVTPPESTSPVSEQTCYGLQTDSSQACSSDGNEWEAKDKPMNNREKVGRPILGAGARLHRNRANDDSDNSRWREQKENKTGWDEKPGGGGYQRSRGGDDSNWRDQSNENKGWDDKQKATGVKQWSDRKKAQGSGGGKGKVWDQEGNKSKGWEHDDRFENDY